MVPENETDYHVQSYTSERLFHRHNNLINNRVYSCYIPRVIIGLSIFYLGILLTVFIFKRHRRHKEKREKREKERFKIAWKKSMMKFHLKTHKTKDNVITHPNNVHTTTYCQSSSSSLTLNSSNTTIAHSHVTKEKFATTVEFLPLKRISERKKSNLSHSKRLNLLWQWGSSMGYCEYSHAKKLNAFIIELQQKYECHRTIDETSSMIEMLCV